MFAKELHISRVYSPSQRYGFFAPSEQVVSDRKIGLRHEHAWCASCCLEGRTPSIGTRRVTLPFVTGRGYLGCPKYQSTLRSHANARGVWNCSSRFGSPAVTAATYGRLGSNCWSYACSASEAERNHHAAGAVACSWGCLERRRHCRRSASGTSANTGAGSATTDPRGLRTWDLPRGRTSQGDARYARTWSG